MTLTKHLIVSSYIILKFNARGEKEKPPREKEVRKPEGEV